MNETHDKRRKRFYEAATVVEVAGKLPRYRVLLDGRGVRTPARREQVVPSRELAEALCDEWLAQATHIDPLTMPLTRQVNSALDAVANMPDAVREVIVDFGTSDLLCYVAEGPEELVARQSREWGAIHAWAQQTFGIELQLAVGVMPVEQDRKMLARIDAALGPAGPVLLAALNVIAGLTGSVLLTLAVRHGRITAAEAWSLAHLDEDFQIERWGEDPTAAARRRQHWIEVAAACRIVAMLEA